MTQTLLVLATFPVDTPFGGGKYVLNNLFRRISSQYNIKFLSLVESDKIYKKVSVSENFDNIHIPQNIEQAKIQWDEEKTNKVGLFDVIQINNWNLNSEFVKEVQKNMDNAAAIILAHPFFANLLKSLNLNIPIIYHAIDLEFNQKKSILNSKSLYDVKNIEKTACEIANQIWVSSESEKNQFLEIFDVTEKKFRILPHGFDLSTAPFIKRELHKEIKSNLKKFSDKTIFVFIGSWHPPNLESLEFIICDLSPMNKNYLYFIIGSVGDFYLQKHPKVTIPENVVFFGHVTDKEKNLIYKLSDYAINPMFSGSGSNLKMLEFMAVGLPIVSTRFGARGIKVSKNMLVCDKENFWKTMEFVCSPKFKENTSILENFMIIKNEYDYGLISKRCTYFLKELLDPNFIYFKNFENLITELNNMKIISDDKLVDLLSKELEVLVNFKSNN